MTFSRPLSKSFPQVADLMRDPIDTLSGGPVAIVDRWIPTFIGLSLACGWLYLLSLFQFNSVKLNCLRYMLMVVILFFPFYVIFWRRRIILDAQGLEYAYGRRSVFIPWSPINGSIASIVHYDTLKVRVHRSAIATVEHRQDGIPVANGVRSSFYFLEISPDGVVALTPPLGAERPELGRLILHVANSLSGHWPQGVVPSARADT